MPKCKLAVKHAATEPPRHPPLERLTSQLQLFLTYLYSARWSYADSQLSSSPFSIACSQRLAAQREMTCPHWAWLTCPTANLCQYEPVWAKWGRLAAWPNQQSLLWTRIQLSRKRHRSFAVGTQLLQWPWLARNCLCQMPQSNAEAQFMKHLINAHP